MERLSLVCALSLAALAFSCNGGDAKQSGKVSTPAQEAALAPFVAASKPDAPSPCSPCARAPRPRSSRRPPDA
jgi:hypothetical protein